MGLSLLGLFLLLVLSAFFSAAETALTSLGKLKVKAIIDSEGRRAEVLNLWLKNPGRFLTTILVGVTISEVSASILAAYLAIKVWGNKGAGIATGLMTLLILVFAEIVPKTFARHHYEKVAPIIIWPLLSISYLLNPVVRFFVLISEGIIHLFGGHLTPQTSHISTEEIRTLIDLGGEEGALAKEEREMLSSVIEIRDTAVDSLMTPRMEIAALPEDASVAEAFTLMAREGHSRLPIYRNDMDDIVGMIDSRQILSCIAEGEKTVLLRQIMRPAFFVPETMKVSDLLKEFRRRKSYLAIVMDEYGGTEGLVTLHDLIEEIIGEIPTEYEETADYQKINDNTYRIKAEMEIEKVNELLNTHLEEDDDNAETIAGFVLKHLGHFPAVSEQFRYQNFLFTVEEADERSISLLLVQNLTTRPSHGTT
ncbi:MAG: hemolysin family protein [Candidatus Omnitrophica bacterium]|nr:hemolysin family protein [Candidatus Omnitrophota bacterium]